MVCGIPAVGGRTSDPPISTVTSTATKNASGLGPSFLSLLGKRVEILAPSADRAAHLLDVALSQRASIQAVRQEDRLAVGLAHMLVTLSVYRYHNEQDKENGGQYAN
ncbi:unnamed protein product [Protopolystoma xenopodis]|uniref:Uncharacterized protein n=1 Tax=Protopolystoma xenopodis TaxID=117903 RepID=A0A3S5FF10_9PLAT|nr:unnamed protein product [Protopolystoma xenopodis]